MLQQTSNMNYWNSVAHPIKHWCRDFHLPMWQPLLKGVAYHHMGSSDADIEAELMKYRLHHHDLEWISRASMITMCLKVRDAQCASLASDSREWHTLLALLTHNMMYTPPSS